MIKKIGSNKYGVVEYAISSVEDIADLPLGVAIGSTAVLINKDGIRTFALGEGEWVEYIDAERYDKNKLAQDLLFCGFGNDGEKHDDLDDRLMVEFDEINERVNVGNYLGYNGCHVKADYSLEGLQRGVMLEGRTLQNLAYDYTYYLGTNGNFTANSTMEKGKNFLKVTLNQPTEGSLTHNWNFISLGEARKILFKDQTTYTFILKIDTNIKQLSVALQDTNANNTISSVGVFVNGRTTIRTDFSKSEGGLSSQIVYVHMSLMKAGDYVNISDLIILEGDHTNTPLEELPFIEGIESVGESELTDDGYKISGKSCGKNLFDKTKLQKNCRLNTGTGGIVETTDNNCITNYIQIKPNTNYCYYYGETYVNRNACFYDEAYNKVGDSLSSEAVMKFTTPQNARYIRLNCFLENLSVTQLEENDTHTPYEPYKESTYSYILDEPLRSLPNGVCDTIDLETGVLTRRVGKVVFKGNETYNIWTNQCVDDTAAFYVVHDLHKQNSGIICNKLPVVSDIRLNTNFECIDTDSIYMVRFRILNSNLESQDVRGVRKLISKWHEEGNPLTIYYELAEPIIHQLDQNRIYSFKDTTHVTSDNLIAPRITTNILTNSNALISHLRGENLALANEVSALSLRNEKTQEINETQDHIIDASLCAVDELYMMYETTQEVEAMSVDEEGSRMVDMYVAMVQRGLKTIDQVPVRYREKVREILAQLED